MTNKHPDYTHYTPNYILSSKVLGHYYTVPWKKEKKGYGGQAHEELKSWGRG